MRTSRFTDEQIIGIVKEYEAGAKLTELCRRHNVSPTTFYKWRAKYGGMAVSDAKRLRGAGGGEPAPEAAAGRHDARQPGAQRVARKKLVTPAARRQAVTIRQHAFTRRSLRPRITTLKPRNSAIFDGRRVPPPPLAITPVSGQHLAGWARSTVRRFLRSMPPP